MVYFGLIVLELFLVHKLELDLIDSLLEQVIFLIQFAKLYMLLSLRSGDVFVNEAV